MMKAVVEGANKGLNLFPAKNGASKVLSPITIMTGRPRPDYNNLKIEFGAYAMVFESNDPTNTNKTRATGAIPMTPTGNAQGGFYFVSLTTGKRLSRQQWDELPMPDGVIARVEALAAEQEQPVFDNGAPLFEWSPGIAIADEGKAPDVVDIDDQGADNLGAAELIEADEDGEYGDQGAEDDGVDEDELKNEGNGEGDDGNPPEAGEGPAPSDNENEDDGNVDNDTYMQDNGDIGRDELENDSDAAEEQTLPEEEEGRSENNGRYNLRPKRDRNYDNRFANSMDNPSSSKSYDAQFLQQEESKTTSLQDAVMDMQNGGPDTNVVKCITGFIMTQMSAKAGIKKHGKAAVEALFQEFLQFHELGVFKAKRVEDLSEKQIKEALWAISVIKEKRCGKLKG
jgi:hypothetical protein